MNNSSLSELHAATAKIRWNELQRFFAQQRLFLLEGDRDLVKIASLIADDATQSISELLNSGALRLVRDNEARDWYASNQLFWCVVVAPYVLIQLEPLC